MKVRHPNLPKPNVRDVDESAVEQYKAYGWELVDETPAAEPVAEPARARKSKTTTEPDAGDKE